MFCKNCGNKLDEESKFCEKCGTKVEEKDDIEKEKIQEEKNVVVDNTIKQKKKSNTWIVVLIVAGVPVVITILIIVVLLGISMLKNKKTDNQLDKNDVENVQKVDDNKTKIEEKDNKEENKEEKIEEVAGKHIYFYYYDNFKESYVAYDTKKDESGTVFAQEYICKTDCSYNKIDRQTMYFLIKDEKYILYNALLNRRIELNITDEIKEIELASDTELDLKGIIINKSKYYDVNKGKITYETKNVLEAYELNGFVEKGYIVINYSSPSECGTRQLINIDTWKTIDDSKVEGKKYYSAGKSNYLVDGCDYFDKYSYLDDNFKNVFDDFYYELRKTDSEVLGYNQNETSYSIYNLNTKETKKVDLGYKIVTIINKFIIAIKDEKYVILDMNHNILKELDEEIGRLAPDPSGYYKAHDDKPEGMYIIMDNGKDECYEYYYDEKNNELKKYDLEVCGGYAKPVLYLYPTKKTNITVDFEHEDMLTTTYPKFKNNWSIIAYSNGDLYDDKGNYYYALYWEEQKNHTVDFKTGFYVEKQNAIEFLEEKLNIIGLNKKERNEFIMYWLPILEKNEKNLVYFELTEERDSYNKLIINPIPDSILRIAIHVKKVNEKIDIKEQQLHAFKRIGFTAVEWGGILYN